MFVLEELSLDKLKINDPEGLIPVLKKFDGVQVEPIQFMKDLYPIEFLPADDDKQHNYVGTPLITTLCVRWEKNKAGETVQRKVGFTDRVTRDYRSIQPFYLEARRFTSDIYLSECGYYGMKKDYRHILCIYGMAIDLDYQTSTSLKAFLQPAFAGDWYPLPTYITLSGTGVHLWYLFDEPIELFHGKKMGAIHKAYANACKAAITERIWNHYTVQKKDARGNDLGNISKQIQSINQSYRMPGTPTKKGNLCTVWRIGEGKKYGSFDEIMSSCEPVIPRTEEIDRLYDQLLLDTGYESASGHDLAYWKEQNPDWYQKRIVEKKKPEKGHYILDQRIYRRYIQRACENAAYGHRYWCMWSAVILGKKCGLSKQEIQSDLEKMMPTLTSIYPDDPMTNMELEDALAAYSDKAYYVKTELLEAKSGIMFNHAKRNGRKQKDHLALTRFMTQSRVKKFGDSKDLLGGRPDKQQIVKEWQESHPDGNKAACIRDTGLSKPTVYKWWTSKK